VPIGELNDLTAERFFREPATARQRQYEALRAYFVEHRLSHEVARQFGYSPGSFRVLCHDFRHGRLGDFFAETRPGPRAQPKKSPARERIVELRKRNYSVYDISAALAEDGMKLSTTAVREVLREEGFAPLPRRLDEERAPQPRPKAEPAADVRRFVLPQGRFTTPLGGLFLFLPDLIRLDVDRLAERAKLPGSRMIPAAHALRASLVLKLWAIERKSHIMALVADPGLALFCGLNAIPKKSFLSEYSARVTHHKVVRLLAAWHEQLIGESLLVGGSFNLDFHSVPYYGEHPAVERHYVSMRSRRQPSVLTFLAQDAGGQVFCYSNADIRKGEEAEEIFHFIDFWTRQYAAPPRHLVFDSKLTTYDRLERLDEDGIVFITLRRRSPKLLEEIAALPPSAWRRVHLDIPTRKYQNPRVYEQKVRLIKRSFRQLYIRDLGHEEPTILLTNDTATHKRLITRYAQRMLIENALSDAVRFFHADALSSSVGFRVDYDMALLVVASGLYRLMARRMRAYADSQARQIFRDLINMPADVLVEGGEIRIRFHRRAHLPIVLASGLMDRPVPVPWWNNTPLRLVE
jgi:transposase